MTVDTPGTSTFRKEKFAITRETLEHLDPVRRQVAEYAIKMGLWRLIDEEAEP